MPNTDDVVKTTAPTDASIESDDNRHKNSLVDQRLNVLEIVGNAIMGGMERHVEMLIRHLPPERFRVTCLLPYESPFTAILRQLGCDVWITRMDDDPPWRSIQFAVELIRQYHIDLVHGHMPRAHVLAGLAGTITKRPVVATLHTQNVPGQDLGISRTTNTHLITVCQSSYCQALALGVPPERVTLIPNGVDTTIFAPKSDGPHFREKLSIPVAAPLVGFVGRLAMEKGPDLFVQMAEYVHRHRPDVHFAIVGDGLMENELTEMIQNRGLQNCVHMAGPHTEMASVYSSFDLCAVTSRSDAVPLALLEAMACGRPVVAMSVGGVAEGVEHSTTGFVVGLGDWVAHGNMILGLLSHPDRIQGMGQAGRARVEQYFNIHDNIQQTTKLFERLVQPRTNENCFIRTL